MLSRARLASSSRAPLSQSGRDRDDITVLVVVITPPSDAPAALPWSAHADSGAGHSPRFCGLGGAPGGPGAAGTLAGAPLLWEPLPRPEPDLSALLEPPAPAPSYAQRPARRAPHRRLPPARRQRPHRRRT